ncbi:hypothetical protein Gpo141_00005142 [Globisporangium polare]
MDEDDASMADARDHSDDELRLPPPPLKHALPFILNTHTLPSPHHARQATAITTATPLRPDASAAPRVFASASAAASPLPPTTEAAAATRSRRAEPSRDDKKRGRMCKTDGCENYIVHKGLCCRHGGGKKCSIEGCNTSAKHRGVCWKHGGSTKCRLDGCERRAKAKGLCWGHGGGTKCASDECDKVAVSNSFCWAHGGGKRCIFDGCSKPGYERTQNFCVKHHAEQQSANYYEH